MPLAAVAETRQGIRVFRRRRRDDATQQDQQNGQLDDAAEAKGADDAAGSDDGDVRDAPTAAVGGARDRGPWDSSEVDDPAAGGRVDLGGMWLPGRPELEVRIEADQTTSEVVAVTLVLGEGALQVQPFAAPRTEGIWAEVRTEIRAGITGQGGTADEVEGPFGTELRTRVPVRAADGSSAVQPARFIGVDGPRWFLRGVVTGRPATEKDADGDLMDLFREIVVVRGDAAMAPRDPIPLALPAVGGADAESEDEDGDTAGSGPASSDDLSPFERGPEITEIR